MKRIPPALWISLLSLLLAQLSTVFLYLKIQHYQALSSLRDGSSICFSRVVQNFTAQMIDDVNSNYLTNQFTQITRTCFDDMSQHHHASFHRKFPQILHLMKLVKTKVQRLQTTSRSPTLSKNHFTKLEQLNDKLLQEIERQHSDVFKYLIAGIITLATSLMLLSAGLARLFYREITSNQT